VGQIDGLGLAHAEIEIVGSVHGTNRNAGVAGSAAVVHIARTLSDHNVKIPWLTRDLLDLGHGKEAYFGVLLDSLKVDFKPTGGRTELGKIFVELGNPPPQVGLFLDDDDFEADLGRLYSSADTGNPSSDYQDTAVNGASSLGWSALVVHG
jgi:hypothetical protein